MSAKMASPVDTAPPLTSDSLSSLYSGKSGNNFAPVPPPAPSIGASDVPNNEAPRPPMAATGSGDSFLGGDSSTEVVVAASSVFSSLSAFKSDALMAAARESTPN